LSKLAEAVRPTEAATFTRSPAPKCGSVTPIDCGTTAKSTSKRAGSDAGPSPSPSFPSPFVADQSLAFELGIDERNLPIFRHEYTASKLLGYHRVDDGDVRILGRNYVPPDRRVPHHDHHWVVPAHQVQHPIRSRQQLFLDGGVDWRRRHAFNEPSGTISDHSLIGFVLSLEHLTKPHELDSPYEPIRSHYER
jgi:hypothetical protein